MIIPAAELTCDLPEVQALDAYTAALESRYPGLRSTAHVYYQLTDAERARLQELQAAADAAGQAAFWRYHQQRVDLMRNP